MSINLFEALGLNMGDPAVIEAVRDASVTTAHIESLRFCRLEFGLTTAQVAERMGISEESVIRLETPGSDPHLSTVRRYATALGVVQRYKIHTINPQEGG